MANTASMSGSYSTTRSAFSRRSASRRRRCRLGCPGCGCAQKNGQGACVSALSSRDDQAVGAAASAASIAGTACSVPRWLSPACRRRLGWRTLRGVEQILQGVDAGDPRARQPSSETSSDVASAAECDIAPRARRDSAPI